MNNKKNEKQSVIDFQEIEDFIFAHEEKAEVYRLASLKMALSHLENNSRLFTKESKER